MVAYIHKVSQNLGSSPWDPVFTRQTIHLSRILFSFWSSVWLWIWSSALALVSYSQSIPPFGFRQAPATAGSKDRIAIASLSRWLSTGWILVLSDLFGLQWTFFKREVRSLLKLVILKGNRKERCPMPSGMPPLTWKLISSLRSSLFELMGCQRRD